VTVRFFPWPLVRRKLQGLRAEESQDVFEPVEAAGDIP